MAANASIEHETSETDTVSNCKRRIARKKWWILWLQLNNGDRTASMRIEKRISIRPAVSQRHLGAALDQPGSPLLGNVVTTSRTCSWSPLWIPCASSRQKPAWAANWTRCSWISHRQVVLRPSLVQRRSQSTDERQISVSFRYYFWAWEKN